MAAPHSTGGNRPRTHPKRSGRKARIAPSRTSIAELSDELHTAACTVDVIANALAGPNDQMGDRAATVLYEHVFQALERARRVLAAYRQCENPESPAGDVAAESSNEKKGSEK